MGLLIDQGLGLIHSREYTLYTIFFTKIIYKIGNVKNEGAATLTNHPHPFMVLVVSDVLLLRTTN